MAAEREGTSSAVTRRWRYPLTLGAEFRGCAQNIPSPIGASAAARMHVDARHGSRASISTRAWIEIVAIKGAGALNPPLAADPEFLAEFGLYNLPERASRKRCPEVNLSGFLEACQP